MNQLEMLDIHALIEENIKLKRENRSLELNNQKLNMKNKSLELKYEKLNLRMYKLQVKLNKTLILLEVEREKKKIEQTRRFIRSSEFLSSVVNETEEVLKRAKESPKVSPKRSPVDYEKLVT